MVQISMRTLVKITSILVDDEYVKLVKYIDAIAKFCYYNDILKRSDKNARRLQ